MCCNSSMPQLCRMGLRLRGSQSLDPSPRRPGAPRRLQMPALPGGPQGGSVLLMSERRALTQTAPIVWLGMCCAGFRILSCCQYHALQLKRFLQAHW